MTFLKYSGMSTVNFSDCFEHLSLLGHVGKRLRGLGIPPPKKKKKCPEKHYLIWVPGGKVMQSTKPQRSALEAHCVSVSFCQVRSLGGSVEPEKWRRTGRGGLNSQLHDTVQGVDYRLDLHIKCKH